MRTVKMTRCYTLLYSRWRCAPKSCLRSAIKQEKGGDWVYWFMQAEIYREDYGVHKTALSTFVFVTVFNTPFRRHWRKESSNLSFWIAF